MRRALVVLLSAGLAAPAQQPLAPKQAPPDPNFSRLYPNTDIKRFLDGYVAAYPEWVKLESLGKASKGEDIWLVTVTNPKTGADKEKPAMLVEAAIHANEIQGSEICVYVLDFVLKNYGKLSRVTELLDRATLYIVPMVSPDSRARWFEGPSNPNFPRTVWVSIDDDRDGKSDEDGYEDLNGDGEITQMRKKVALGQGRFKLDPKDARNLLQCPADELCDYQLLGTEGIDNDNDGLVNEDPIGYVDPNRSWGAGFQPRYVQQGAPDYPLQIPETRAIAEFLRTHDNVGAAQDFHNTGGYILRGPGAKSQRPYPAGDVRAMDLIGKEGEKMLPGYRYGTAFGLLYDAYASTDDHMYLRHGAITFTNELHRGLQADTDKNGQVSAEESLKFNDTIAVGRQYIDWRPHKHPQYGDIEIGGYRHDTGRMPEPFDILSDCHRNAAFVLFHAHHLPRLAVQSATVSKIDGDLYRIQIPVVNDRAIPSMTEIARQNKLTRPDIATVVGGKVIASGIVRDPYLHKVDYQSNRPDRLMVYGVRGYSSELLEFLVENPSRELTFTYDSVKGGKVTAKIPVR